MSPLYFIRGRFREVTFGIPGPLLLLYFDPFFRGRLVFLGPDFGKLGISPEKTYTIWGP